MSRMLCPPGSLATGIGALPHIDPDAGCRAVLEAFPEFPYAPTLPNRGPCEAIVFSDVQFLPGRVREEGRIYSDTRKDLTAEMEKIYLDYVEGNYTRYAPTERYASGFHAMMRQDLSGSCKVKCQLTGPVTLGMQVTDLEKKPLWYDGQFADVLPKMIALRARWYEKEMIARTGIDETLVVLNEPYLASIGSSVVPVDPETVRTGWQDIAMMIDGGLGVHCCSNTDWGFVMSLRPSVVSLDAYANAPEFLLYRDDLVSYYEDGGVVAWGIVPADHRVFSTGTVDSLHEKYLGIRKAVTEYVPEKVFDAQSLITPNCGIRFADEAGAAEIMGAAAEISRRVREIAGNP
ncbi:MAG: hypothetical protein LUQ25_08250 [Methanoregulaceae archaeon]|nr:hypothetical protein [Methanoregulaceae archaeon]